MVFLNLNWLVFYLHFFVFLGVSCMNTANLKLMFTNLKLETMYVILFCIGCCRWRTASGVLLKTRSSTLEIYLNSTLFQFCLNILFPMQLLSFVVIGSVIQVDYIKAISAKWNMCPVNAAHSLFIRLLTSETNLKKTKLFMALWIGGALTDVIQGMCCTLIYSECY